MELMIYSNILHMLEMTMCALSSLHLILIEQCKFKTIRC